MKPQLSDLIKQSVPQADRLLLMLDFLKDEVADVRNGDYSAKTRKCAIEMIDSVLYNKIKSAKLNEVSKPQ